VCVCVCVCVCACVRVSSSVDLVTRGGELGAKGEHASTCRFFDATPITRTRVARFRGGVIGSRFIRQKKERGHPRCDPSFSRATSRSKALESRRGRNRRRGTRDGGERGGLDRERGGIRPRLNRSSGESKFRPPGDTSVKAPHAVRQPVAAAPAAAGRGELL